MASQIWEENMEHPWQIFFSQTLNLILHLIMMTMLLMRMAMRTPLTMMMLELNAQTQLIYHKVTVPFLLSLILGTWSLSNLKGAFIRGRAIGQILSRWSVKMVTHPPLSPPRFWEHDHFHRGAGQCRGQNNSSPGLDFKKASSMRGLWLIGCPASEG